MNKHHASVKNQQERVVPCEEACDINSCVMPVLAIIDMGLENELCIFSEES